MNFETLLSLCLAVVVVLILTAATTTEKNRLQSNVSKVVNMVESYYMKVERVLSKAYIPKWM